MAVTTQHRIRRMVLELRTPNEESANRVQPELSRIHRQYLAAVIERCCSELSPPGRIYRVERLELDLGTVDFGHLERELPEKLNSVLRKALAREIEKQDSDAYRGNQDPAVTSQLELIAFFAATGTFPWWADSSYPRLIPETLTALLDLAPDRLADLLQTIVLERDQLVRIVLHADDNLLSGLVSVLSASLSSTLSPVPPQPAVVTSIWPHVPATEQARVRNWFWLALLHQLGTVPGPITSLWQQVFAEIETQSHDVYVSLVTGILRAARSSRDSTPALIAQLLDATGADRQGRVFSRLPPNLQSEITELLDGPAGAQSDAMSTTSASGTMSTSGTTSTSGATSTTGTTSALESEAVPFRLVSRERTSQPRPLRPSLDLDLGFGDADTVYIGNSGLVILWPFLPRFFARLELVADDKFGSPAAQHRAAGLMQYLVTQDPSPPEYQTTLNKILCGLDPGTVLEFDTPVTLPEAEECATLLTAVIAQAPILRDMSHDAFRGSFLLRDGLLSSRDGVWLLRVERETYDVVLDRFPWTLSWVKLPWMEVPLGVEW